jgi:hypothetical protein
VVGATIGAVAVFLIARSALGDVLAERAGPALSRFREGFQQDAFNYLLFLAACSDFSVLAREFGPWTARRQFRYLSRHNDSRHYSRTFAYSLAGSGLDSVLEAQQAAHQSCLAKMGPGGQESCPYTLDPGALLTPELIVGLVALGLVALVPVGVKWFRRTSN